MDQQNTSKRLRRSLGGAIRENDLIGKPWRKFRRAQALPGQRFRVGLERPASRDVVSSRIHVRGWAVSLDGQPVSGQVFLDGEPVLELEFEQERADVSVAFDLALDEQNVGFESFLEWNRYCSGKSEVEFRLEFSHGAELLVLGPITVSKTDSPLLLHERGSYKEVWNKAGEDAEYARDAVAGISDFSEFMQSGEDSAKTIGEVLRVTQDDIVLEIGCGAGRIGAWLAPKCKLWIGTDISAGMVRHAGENLKDRENVRLVELSGCDLEDFADASIDKIYCSTVFMHLDEWDRYRYVSEAYRVLRPGGRAYVDNLNLSGDTGWEIFQQVSRLDSAHRPANVSKASTTEELVTYLSRAGFESIETFPGAHMVGVAGVKP